MLKQYIGKEIQLFPIDTYEKFGTLLGANENGILVKITKADKRDDLYKVGDTHFIAYSAKLTFKIID